MKVLLLSVGSRGDVEPYCALTKELLQRGHSVEIFLQQNWAGLAKPFQRHPNFTLRTFSFGNQDFYKIPPQTLVHEDPKTKSVGVLANIIARLVLPCSNQVLQVAKHCDMVISCAFTRPLAFLMAKLLNTPTILIHLQPLVPNTIFPCYRTSRDKYVAACVQQQHTTCRKAIGTEDITSKKSTTTLPTTSPTATETNSSLSFPDTYWIIEEALEMFFLRAELEKLYQHYGMTPMTWPELQDVLCGSQTSGNNNNDSIPIWVVNGYTHELIPRIKGSRGIGPRLFEVGPLADDYLSLDFDPRKSKELKTFLNECSDPPICIGFGSMGFSKDHLSMIFKALRVLQFKSILVGPPPPPNFHSPNDSSQTFYAGPSVPYSWLLPQCSAMMCHGGAGVVAACLHAGIPMVVFPQMGDQFSFGALVQSMGYGVTTSGGSGRKLTIFDDMIELIQQAMHPKVRSRCQSVGSKIRQQKHAKVSGVPILVEEIERIHREHFTSHHIHQVRS